MFVFYCFSSIHIVDNAQMKHISKQETNKKPHHSNGKLLFVLLIVGSLIGYYFYIQFYTEKIEEFCQSISFGDSYVKVYQLAKAQDLTVPFYAKSAEQLIVYNHPGPLFKVYCDIHFSDQKVYSTKLSTYKLSTKK